MFDLAAVQAALRDARPRRLAALRLPRPQRPGPPRPRLARPTPSCRGAGSTSSRPRASRASWSTASSRTPSTTCPAQPQSYLRWQELEAGVAALVARRAARGDGVRAAQRQPLRLARRCRHRRTGALLRRRGRAVGRPGPAVRGVLGRRAVGHAPGGGQAHALRLRRRLRLHRRARPRAAARVRETEVQQRILDHFAKHGLVTDHPPIVAVGPHSGDPHYAPAPGDRRADPRGRFRADRPVGQARQAARRLQRPDLDRLRRQARCRRSTQEIFQIVAAARDAAIDRVRDGLRQRTSRCRAGRWTRRPAT